MSDKTCVTCGKGVRYIVTCSDREHQHAGLHQPDDTCRDYVERTDSVEQVALDMLGYIHVSNDSTDYISEESGERAEQEYRDRLHALGIEVPE